MSTSLLYGGLIFRERLRRKKLSFFFVVLHRRRDGRADPPLFQRIGQHLPVYRVGDETAFDEHRRAVRLPQHLEIGFLDAPVFGEQGVRQAELDAPGQLPASDAAGITVGLRPFGIYAPGGVAVDADEQVRPPLVGEFRPPVNLSVIDRTVPGEADAMPAQLQLRQREPGTSSILAVSPSEKQALVSATRS